MKTLFNTKAFFGETYLRISYGLQSLLVLWVLCLIFSCNNSNKSSLSPEDISFFGDSVSVIKSTNRPNGYEITVLCQRHGVTMIHFKRGNNIDKYIVLEEMPYIPIDFADKPGTHSAKFDFPVMKVDSLSKGSQFMFMDVNFDGEEEFLVKYIGAYNDWYVCYDITGGNNSDLGPIQEEPFDYLPAGCADGGRNETVFDFKNESFTKETHWGVSYYYSVTAKKIKDPKSIHYNEIVVVREVVTDKVSEFESGEVDNSIYTIEKEMINDSMKVVKEHTVHLD